MFQLLAENADIFAINYHGRISPCLSYSKGNTPLHFSCCSPNPSNSLLSFMVDAGYDVNVKNKAEETPLDW